MIQTIHSYGGVTATVYVMGKGEKIARHQHPFPHTTSVAAGQSEVEIYYDVVPPVKPMTMLPGDTIIVLPPNIDHEIRALVDGTVVVNLSVVATVQNQEKYSNPIPKAGGVELHDGTVIDAE